jgi:RNA polymerase sigma-70 factor (ECF subfamily)
VKDSWDGTQDPLAALRAGRPAPFEEFVRSETRTFLAYFVRLGATRSEAEDLAQETFLKLFRSAAASSATSYDVRGQFAGYAFRVARNVWIDRIRRTRGAGPGPMGDVTESQAAVDHRLDRSAASPEDGLVRREGAEVVREAVATLSEGHRIVFELAVVEELPYAAIAEALDIPLGTVKSRMHSAVARVRGALEERERVENALRERQSGSGGGLQA